MTVEHGCCGSSDGDTTLALDGEGVEDGDFFFVVIAILDTAVGDGVFQRCGGGRRSCCIRH